MDSKFWKAAGISFGIALLALASYDGIRTYMAKKNGGTSNFGGALRFGRASNKTCNCRVVDPSTGNVTTSNMPCDSKGGCPPLLRLKPSGD